MIEKAEYIRASIDFLQRFIAKGNQKRAEGFGLTVPQMRVIVEVAKDKNISIKQLTQNLKMTQSTVSEIVERLIGKGIVTKTPNPQDKRSVIITLTEAAEEAINKGDNDYLNHMILDVLNQLEANEQESFVHGMHLFVEAVKEKMVSEGMDYEDSYDVLNLPKKTDE
ncbi:MarR family transcriptional regulator [Terribacillus saccharophilus]|uniref:MarR family winged helix-turn-helix transcriptional regulator n=1 Tax=Terribacillus saccharophilus TaxID=361277 RepID=UPI00398217D8